jgi:hypothetical protein
MRTYGSDVRHQRTLAQIIEDSAAIIWQDAGEYGFIALLGAFPACIAVVLLAALGGPLFAALVVPAILYSMALTLAAGGAAFQRVTANLAPDATEAWGASLKRAGAVTRPWTAPALLGFVVVFGLQAASSLFDTPWTAVTLACVAALAAYTLPRTFYVPALLLTEGGTPRECEAGSAQLVAVGPRKTLAAWAAVLAPAVLATLAAASSGFALAWSAIAVFVFIGSMPAAAVMCSLLFYDALANAERVQPPRRAAGVRPARAK